MKILATSLAFLELLFPFATIGFKQENAYITVFKALASALEFQNLEYLAVDLSGVELDDTTKLEKVIQAYCDEHEITMLPYDFDWLVEEGYIEVETRTDDGEPYEYWHFPDGMMLGFYVREWGSRTVRSIGTRSMSNNASGTDYLYAVQRNLGVWIIIERYDLTWHD